MKQLRISRDFTLPLDVAGEAIAILAKRGAGKTNTATVLVEELVAANVQTVIVDPVGAWWGIRSSAQGEKGAGLAIPILGGQHGDVTLEQTAGTLIADVVVDSGSSLLLDLSDFPSKASVARFVTDFAERLYRRKGRASSLLHLVLEEADEFAPQGQRAETARMRGAIEQIVRRGRSRGLGVTLITQRSAVLNKDVLTQTDVLVVMRTTGPHDVKAIREWVAARGDEHGESVIESLPSLATGEAWFWNPERDLLKRAKVRKRRTFDSSATPKAGEKRAEPGDVAAIDLASLGEQIEATVERAKENDPTELRKQVRDLNRQLEQVRREHEDTIGRQEVETVVERIEVPVLNGNLGKLEDAVKAMQDVAQKLVNAGELVLTGAREITAAIDTVATSRERQAVGPPAPPLPAPRAAHPRTAARPTPRATADGEAGVSGPQQRILNALAALEAIGVREAHKTQLALFAEASPKSSSYSNNLGHLNNQLGLIHYPSPGRVALTDAGRQVADASAAPASTEELHDFVYGLVGGPKAKLLEALIAAYDEPLTKQELAERVGASVSSSSFSNNLGSLRSLGLIDYPSPGWVVALPVLFLEEV